MSVGALSGGMLRDSSGALIVRGLGGQDDYDLGVLAAPHVPGPLGLTNVTLLASITYLVRIMPARDFLAKSIGFGVATAAGANDTCELGIYDAAMTRLVTTGAVAGKLNVAAGPQVQAITHTQLRAGTPSWLALALGAFGGTAAVLNGYAFNGLGYNFLLDEVMSQGGVARTYAFSSLQASLPGLSTGGTNGPVLVVREW
jgi:hypothetical protein